MKGKILVTFHHSEKIAKMKILDKNNNIMVDKNNKIMENMQFPYSHLEFYKDLFEKIDDDGAIGNYYFNK
ncbi:MAG: hypothetical protein PSN34_08100 [Urechidicola sp.]|nr:hypothetical protein [Urechidicola sp.]